MSFLEELKNKKSKLKNTDTLVKTTSGEVFLEKKQVDGKVVLEKVATAPGFVVDLKPDLQVALVLPGLCMGSQDVTQDETLLQKHQITHILSVGIHVPQLHGVSYIFIESLDVPEFDMKLVFIKSKQLIDEIRNSGGTALVHCNAGVSRSASIVIAYLMQTEKMSYNQAFNLLKLARPSVKPNEGFVKQLKALERELFDNK